MKTNDPPFHSFAVGILLLPALVLFITSAPGLRATPAESKNTPGAAIQHYNLDADKLALKGYDPVGYFTRSQALKGRKDLIAGHEGVTYWFASEENRRLFMTSPEKYLPTYGGWCATAMARGEKIEIDPTNFKVTNGRLFLFYKGLWGNALKDWNKDEPGLTVRADANWKKLVAE